MVDFRSFLIFVSEIDRRRNLKTITMMKASFVRVYDIAIP